MNLNQVTLPSLDLSKALEFYKTLGFELIVKSLPDYIRFLCPGGNSTLSIHKVDQLSKGNGAIIYFECDNIDKKFQELKNKGVEFDTLPTDQPRLWKEANLKDVDDNQIILFQAGGDRVNPPWRVVS